MTQTRPERSGKDVATSPEFSRDISAMPGAVDVLRELSAHAEIFIATTAMDHPNSLIDRYHWLRENGRSQGRHSTGETARSL